MAEITPVSRERVLLDSIVNDPAYVVNNVYDYIYINFNKKLTVQMISQVRSII